MESCLSYLFVGSGDRSEVSMLVWQAFTHQVISMGPTQFFLKHKKVYEKLKFIKLLV